MCFKASTGTSPYRNGGVTSIILVVCGVLLSPGRAWGCGVLRGVKRGGGGEFTNPLDRCSELHMEEAVIMKFSKSGYSGGAFFILRHHYQF